jgi:hypothetical protein
VNFGEGKVLLVGGMQMVQDENGDGGREGAVGEGEGGGVALHYITMA